MTTQRGFSLVELLVVLVIFMIVTGAVFQLLNVAQVRYRAEKQFLESFQGARIGVDLMVRDIHNAGYPRPYIYAGNLPLQNPASPVVPSEAPTYGPTPLTYDPLFVPWEEPTKAAPALQTRFAVGIVGVRGGAVDLTCTVQADPTLPKGVTDCDVPNSFDVILELDIDPESTPPPALPSIEWVRYQLCWVQADGTCDPDTKGPGDTTILVRAVDIKDAVSDPSAVVSSDVPFVENIVQDPTVTVGNLLPDGTRNAAVFTYVCAGGAASCTVEQIEDIIITLRVRSVEPDIQTRQQREITLRGLARRLNPSR
jgi:prepilin-type N-terminal cleavage/methylation domain-containing protein